VGRLVTEIVTDLAKNEWLIERCKFLQAKNALSISEKGSKSLRLKPLSGGLVGIDQEVVTLRGLYGYSGFLTDLRQANQNQSLLTDSMRAVALGGSSCELRAQSPA
jgi:hypothetical protein